MYVETILVLKRCLRLGENGRSKRQNKRYVIKTRTDSGRVVRVPQQDLRSRVGQRAARRLQLLARIEPVAEAKVGQLHHAERLEEHHVLGLQVAVDHVKTLTQNTRWRC